MHGLWYLIFDACMLQVAHFGCCTAARVTPQSPIAHNNRITNNSCGMSKLEAILKKITKVASPPTYDESTVKSEEGGTHTVQPHVDAVVKVEPMVEPLAKRMKVEPE